MCSYFLPEFVVLYAVSEISQEQIVCYSHSLPLANFLMGKNSSKNENII